MPFIVKVSLTLADKTYSLVLLPDALTMNRIKLTTLLMTVLLPISGTAGLRHYTASITGSNWEVTRSDPLICQLEHNIPRYGTAVFTSKAGHSPDMQMVLDKQRIPAKQSRAKLVSVPPPWKPGRAAKTITQFDTYRGFDSGMTNELAWTVLSELENGNQPTFYYDDGYNRFDQVAVALSSANFRKGYERFIGCVGSLLPFNFDDIQLTVLNYEKNSNRLNLESRRRLSMVAEYLKHDETVFNVSVDAYSDSFGGRWHNLELSKKRAGMIKNYLVESGVAQDKIAVTGFGEKRHVAPNLDGNGMENAEGRALNRRVVIQLTRDPIAVM